MAAKFKIKKGDRVVVLTGRDKGRTGEVLRVIPTEDRLVVQGVKVVKRHERSSQTSAGGIVEQEATIPISNVAHIDPKTDQPTDTTSVVEGKGGSDRVDRGGPRTNTKNNQTI